MVNLATQQAANASKIANAAVTAITTEIAEALDGFGLPSSRMFKDETVDFDPTSLNWAPIAKRGGKPGEIQTRNNGKKLYGAFMKCQVTNADGQVRVVEVNLVNDVLALANNVLLGDIAKITNANSSVADRVAAFTAWLQQNAAKKFTISDIQPVERRRADGTSFTIDHAVYTIAD